MVLVWLFGFVIRERGIPGLVLRSQREVASAVIC